MLIQRDLPPLTLPNLCDGRSLLRCGVLAQAVALVLAFAPGQHQDIFIRLGVISVVVHWITYCTVLILCSCRHWLNRLTPGRILLSTTMILLSVTVVISYLAYTLAGFSQHQLSQSAISFIIGNLMVASIVAVIAMLFFIMHAERNLQVQAQSRAELTALQARIQPHFLFNSLNTVAELIHADPTAAEQALLDLSALFRAALHAGENVSLTDELQLARQYLSLEQWRLGKRLSLLWNIPTRLADATIPSLTIQPLLENAIRYGVECSMQESLITADYIETRTSIAIVITNPFYGPFKTTHGNGIALNNIRQRLRLNYDEGASLTAGVVDGSYRVKLVFPKSKEIVDADLNC